jgi:acetone carboxylase, beta subunit
MAEAAARNPRVLAIDAGGTMTDTFIVDESGSFVVGKAQTTPDDESVGFMESAQDALKQWGSSPGDAFGAIASGIYSGTAMLNRLLSRQGLEIGAIVTAGQEDYLKIERGIQTYLGYSYSDRLHLATHYHNPPLVPRERMKGVRGRIDVFGDEVAPLREADARSSPTATPSTRSGSARSSRRRRRSEGSTTGCRSSCPPSSIRSGAICRGSTRR